MPDTAAFESRETSRPGAVCRSVCGEFIRSRDGESIAGGSGEEKLHPASHPALARGMRHPASDQLLKMEPGAAEPDLQSARELRGGQGLLSQEVQHADAGRMGEGPHRFDTAEPQR